MWHWQEDESGKQLGHSVRSHKAWRSIYKFTLLHHELMQYLQVVQQPGQTWGNEMKWPAGVTIFQLKSPLFTSPLQYLRTVSSLFRNSWEHYVALLGVLLSLCCCCRKTSALILSCASNFVVFFFNLRKWPYSSINCGFLSFSHSLGINPYSHSIRIKDSYKK